MAETRIKKVLLVEDSADDEHLTLRGLSKVSVPHKVDVVRDGSEAVQYLVGIESEPDRPDLILLDLKLPKLNGIEVLKRIRSGSITRSIPVVILTSSDEESDVRGCYDNGANSYVCKPVEYELFLRSVRSIGEFWLEMATLPTLVGSAPQTAKLL